MDLSYDLLKVLIAVAESPNFRAAAERLRISQPAVTFKLKELEATQPFPVFTLEGRRKVLTRYGRSLYEVASSGAHRLSRDIETLHRTFLTAKSLTVRIAGRQEVLRFASRWLEFDGQIEFVNCSSQSAVSRLLRHEVDLAITYIVPDSASIQAKPLFKSHAFFRIHENLLVKKRMNQDLLEDAEFLKTTPCIFYGREGHLIRDLIKHLNMGIEDLNVRYVTDDWSTVQNLVDEAKGYSILPFYVPYSEERVRQIEIPRGITKPVEFYALFETGLKKIDAFKPLLSFSNLTR